MKYFLLIIGFLLLTVGVSALLEQTDYMNLPFSLDGAQIEVGVWLLVGASLAFLLSSEAKQKLQEKVN